MIRQNEARIRQLALAVQIDSIAALAREAGVDKHTVYLALAGISRPRRETLRKLARVLHVPSSVVARALGVTS